MPSNHDDDESCNTNEDDVESVNSAKDSQPDDISAILAKRLISGATEALGYEATMLFLNWFIEAIKQLM